MMPSITTEAYTKGGETLNPDLIFTYFVKKGFPIVSVDSRGTKDIILRIPFGMYAGDPYMEFALCALLQSYGNLYSPYGHVRVNQDGKYIRFAMNSMVGGRRIMAQNIVDRITDLCVDNEFEGLYGAAKEIAKNFKYMNEMICAKTKGFLSDVKLERNDLDLIIDIQISGELHNEKLIKFIELTQDKPLRHLELKGYKTNAGKHETLYSMKGFNGTPSWGLMILTNPGCDIESDIASAFQQIVRLV